jgi:AcrR family transcriptional regulator
MNKSGPRGRRVGSPETKQLIREVATRRFLAQGYQAVTMRSIATEAGVDVALVSYYFGSKKGLFGATMALPANPAELFQQELRGDLDTLAVRILRRVLQVWDSPQTGTPLKTFAFAATADVEVNRLIREIVGREIIDRLGERIGGPAGRQRAGAFCTQIVGLIFSRYVLRLEPVASMPADEVIKQLGPPLQLVLRPPGHRLGLVRR